LVFKGFAGLFTFAHLCMAFVALKSAKFIYW